MKIEILGTGASEGIPAVYCECAICREAARRGGKNIRSRASLMIGEKHKVDLPPDTFLHSLRRGKPFSKVGHLFFTHSHPDHFYPHSLRLRARTFAYIESRRPLHIYGTETIEDGLKEALGSPLPEGLEFHSIEVFHSFEAGEIEVVPVKASHKAGELCLNYVFMSRGKGFLQAFDTGWYPDKTWNALGGLLLDAAIIECTAAKLDEPPTSHLGVNSLIRMKEKLIEERALRENARVIATHLCHMGGLLHEELEQALLPAGIEVAYDEMLVEI